jgi:ABC-type phosphate/phosphonate transport system substrate-binding protein
MTKAYVERAASKGALEPSAQFQFANGSVGFRACLIAHADSDIFTPEDIAGRTFAFNDSTSGYPVPAVSS